MEKERTFLDDASAPRQRIDLNQNYRSRGAVHRCGQPRVRAHHAPGCHRDRLRRPRAALRRAGNAGRSPRTAAPVHHAAQKRRPHPRAGRRHRHGNKEARRPAVFRPQGKHHAHPALPGYCHPRPADEGRGRGRHPRLAGAAHSRVCRGQRFRAAKRRNYTGAVPFAPDGQHSRRSIPACLPAQPCHRPDRSGDGGRARALPARAAIWKRIAKRFRYGRYPWQALCGRAETRWNTNAF